MYLIIVEDDSMQAQSMIEHLTDNLIDVRIESIRTESEFYDWAKRCADEKQAIPLPDLIILDIMLRWSDPKRKDARKEPPETVKKQGFYNAGLRCEEKLRENERTKELPVIFYSIMENGDIEEDLKKRNKALFLQKDIDINELVKAIKEKLRPLP